MACSASEIVAWKVPLDRFAWDGVESVGIVRCESAPETSPFFKEGDELWELKKMPVNQWVNQPLSAEWVVWNASSGRLVAKGDWSQISILHDFLRPREMPSHCRLIASLFPVVDVTHAVAKDSQPVAEVSLFSRSGMKSKAIWSGDGNTISVEAEMAYGESVSFIDARLAYTAKAADQADMKVNTGLTIRSGESVWVARDFDGKQGLDLVVSGVIESLDGTPICDRVMIQNGKQTESLKLSHNGPSTELIRIGESGWFARIWASKDVIWDCISPGQAARNNDVDPFADPPEKRSPFPMTSSIPPPAFIQPWLNHEVLAAGKWFETVGLCMKQDDDFIGYDPITETLFVYSRKREFVEHFKSLFGCLDGERLTQLIVTFAGVGQTRLIARAGQKASLSRNKGEKEDARYLEIEPTCGESGTITDLRFFFNDRTDPERSVHLNSSVSLFMGEWSEIANASFGGGVKYPLRVKAEIFRPTP